MARAYLIFHLNLAFSSIPEASRPQVIEKCYWPLLALIDRSGIPVGVELTGWTLQQIECYAPDWVERFRSLLHAGRCELIGSGWSQSIGPLMPHVANVWNQRLGMQAYEKRLDCRPSIALVNEMAFSTSMVDLYGEAGYRGLIMDRDNVRLALGLDHRPLSDTPTHAQGCDERALPLLWSDSILFQRLQRAVHGDIPIAEYLRYVARRAATDGDEAILPLYCNDAEIFDYRPGRFATEPRMHPEGEWARLERILTRLAADIGIDWLSPSEALAVQSESGTRVDRLASASHPIPVKKQAKYNLSRWAVTGRDDLWLNTLCHRLARQLESSADATEHDWRTLCEFWASDFRTHISEDRWQRLLGKIDPGNAPDVIADDSIGESHPLSERVGISHEPEGIFWEIKTRGVRMVLNARRGLTIHSLAFADHDFAPILGTLDQGYFSTISMGADFYSGGILIEIPGDRRRLTDLEWVDPTIQEDGDWIRIRGRLPLGQGTLVKEVAVHLETQRLRLSYHFDGMERPLGVVRVGMMTLFSDSLALPLQFACHNGGPRPEVFVLEESRVGHGQAVSSLVSSQSGLGATQGELQISDATGRGMLFAWQPELCAALPMLTHEEHHGRHFTRLSFSLSELDDTSRPGGRLLPFSFDVTPCH